jgi:hypothetical protein
MARRLALALTGVCCLTAVGCIEKASGADGVVYSYQTWVPALLVVGGIAALPLGVVVFRRKNRFWGVILTVAGPVAAGVVAPGMFLDKVVVGEDGFTSRHGFWWNPSIHTVRYEDLNQVRLTVEERSGRRGKKYSYYFDCDLKSGRQERVPLGDIMREAVPDIAAQFRRHDVPVHIPPNLPD